MSIQIHLCSKFHSRFLKEEEEEEMDVYTSYGPSIKIQRRLLLLKISTIFLN